EGTELPITIFTDHKNLEWWKESRTFNRRHARWHLLLSAYNFEIHYRPGKQSNKPDALSRRSDHASEPLRPQTMIQPEALKGFTAGTVSPLNPLQQEIQEVYEADESLSLI